MNAFADLPAEVEYFGRANLYLVLFFVCYWLLLRRHTFFALNRWYLLGSVVASALLPLITLPAEPDDVAVMAQPIMMALPMVANVAPEPTGPHWPMLAFWCYVVVAATLLARTVWNVARLVFRLARAPQEPRDGYVLAQPDRYVGPTFSFFRYVVINPQDADSPAVLAHEQAHVRQGHTYDVLFMEMVQALCWANPVVWLYGRAIRQQHEFLADAEAARYVADRTDYAQLLVHHALGGAAVPLVHSFTTPSLLKSRVQMLFQRATSRWAVGKYALVLPLAALLLSFTAARVAETATLPSADGDLTARGVVRGPDGKTLASVEIMVVANQKLKQRSATLADGTYQLSGLSRQDRLVFHWGDRIVQKNFDSSVVDVKFPSQEEMRRNYPIRADANVPQPGNGITLQGVVTGPDGGPLPGTNIVVRGGQRGTSTDASGNYKIGRLKAGDKLVFSFLGANSQIVDVQSSGAVNVAFREFTPNKLNAVEAYGYVDTTKVKKGSGAETNEIFTVVEQQPQFPGGTKALYEFIGRNLRYPDAAKKALVEGRVFVQFIVNTDGSVQNILILKGAGFGLDEEAVRVIAKMPNWTPGRQSGQPVRVQFNLPIEFKLEKSGRKVGQVNTPNATSSETAVDGEVRGSVEVLPSFRGGSPALYRFIAKNLSYPPAAQRANVEGKVFVEFVVGRDGTVRDARVLKGIGFGLDEEALRVVSALPKWTPGRSKGQPVAVKLQLPIEFLLDNKKKMGQSFNIYRDNSKNARYALYNDAKPKKFEPDVTLYGDKNGVEIEDNAGPGKRPLMLVDDKEYSGDIKNIKPETISEVNVLKGSSGTAIYGEKAKYGVIRITTKKNATSASESRNDAAARPRSAEPVAENIRVGKGPGVGLISVSGRGWKFKGIKPYEDLLVIVDGIEAKSDAVAHVKADDILTMDAVQSSEAMRLYGEKGKHGAIRVTTKKAPNLPRLPGADTD